MKEESTLGLMGGCESSPGYYDGEEPFEHGRSMALEGFTVKELVDELSKRGVLECPLYHQIRNTRLWSLNGQYREAVIK